MTISMKQSEMLAILKEFSSDLLRYAAGSDSIVPGAYEEALDAAIAQNTMGVETSDEFYRIEYRSEDDPHIWTYYADYPVNRCQSTLYAFESVSKCSDVVEVQMLKCRVAKHFYKVEDEQ